MASAKSLHAPCPLLYAICKLKNFLEHLMRILLVEDDQKIASFAIKG